MTLAKTRRDFGLLMAAAAISLTTVFTGHPAMAQVTAFRQALAETVASDRDLAGFYRDNGFAPIWTGDSAGDRARRKALVRTLSEVDLHGLPAARYDLAGLMERMGAARSSRDLGLIEGELSRTFLRLARDMQSGVLVPSRVDGDIKREVLYVDPVVNLTDLTTTEPRAFFRTLAPQGNEYVRLMKEKLRLEHLLAQGGWGATVPASTLKPGAAGAPVVALRNRLIRMGYLARSASQHYDASVQTAVQAFQADHGLEQDGVAGASTIAALNVSMQERLKSVIVAMERERWLTPNRGKRHILVNLTDFSARIMDDDHLTFETRAVIGKNASDRRSPEFSDVMEHLVINPTWHVPRSIAVKEYLPQMKRNRNAASHLRLYDSRGREVSRGAVNFGAYTARNFPFAIKQPPSTRNALGLVKFIFPNKYNIYLHDTPQKALFAREKRDFSHGCIRLQQPFDFAYQLLSKQEDDPRAFFHSVLNTGRETHVPLKTQVPVHLIYRTAFTKAKGRTQYRDDVYGRDARIWQALEKAGVSLGAVQG